MPAEAMWAAAVQARDSAVLRHQRCRNNHNPNNLSLPFSNLNRLNNSLNNSLNPNNPSSHSPSRRR